MTQHFPSPGYASLQGQMVRAAESIVFNIAEGCGATSQREFARFLGIGIKSSFELESQCEIARDYEILCAVTWQELDNAVVDVRRMLFGLRKKVLLSPHSKRLQAPHAQRPTVDA